MNKNFLASVMAFFLLAGCDGHSAQTFQAYIENDLTYLSSPVAGKLEALYVARGQTVTQAAPLFQLDANPQNDELSNAKANLNVALANLHDLEKGARDTQLDEIRAQIEAAKASVEYNEKELLRRKSLLESDNIPIDMFDQTMRDLASSQAQLTQYKATLADAELPARVDQIAAAEASVFAAIASVKKATWTLLQKTVRAPFDGFVFDTFYEIGEEVPANIPVLALLIPKNTKAITYIPASELSRIHLGDSVKVSCAHCNAVSGEVSFISPNAEYTPPVIYSRENNAKLVFRVEVAFAEDVATQLHPGQPVELTF